ncbi:MAG: type II toxin-antitoxin system Phd/YefM family antitoxin [Acidobacteria bacterium]|nr:type II toxin-antitoxin system Phd/YefM family antitoxin [Acidobacteriota bacterium]
MKVYTYSEARKRLAIVLEQAGKEGEVRIRRQDGQVFAVRPERSKSSPLDVGGLNLRLTRKENVNYVRAGRKPVPEVRPLASRSARPKRRSNLHADVG